MHTRDQVAKHEIQCTAAFKAQRKHLLRQLDSNNIRIYIYISSTYGSSSNTRNKHMVINNRRINDRVKLLV